MGVPSGGMGTGLPAGGTRSAGPNFSAMRNWGKNRQRRGLPPPCGIHPAGTRPLLRQGDLRPLAWWGHIDGMVILLGAPTLLLVRPSTPQGLTLEKQLFPAAGGLAPGGGNAASPGEARSWKPPGHRASCPEWPGVVAQPGATARVTGRGKNRRSSGLVPQGGSLGGNALSGFFVYFWPVKNRPQRSAPTRLAGLNPPRTEGQAHPHAPVRGLLGGATPKTY